MKIGIAPSIMAMALAASVNTAIAADFDADRAIQGLVVSGVVESWSGVTLITNTGGSVDPDQDSYLASGQSGRLSLPNFGRWSAAGESID